MKLGLIAREFEASGGYGMAVPVKVGSAVTEGGLLVRLCGEKAASEEMLAALARCFTISDESIPPDPLIYRIVI